MPDYSEQASEQRRETVQICIESTVAADHVDDDDTNHDDDNDGDDAGVRFLAEIAAATTRFNGVSWVKVPERVHEVRLCFDLR